MVRMPLRIWTCNVVLSAIALASGQDLMRELDAPVNPRSGIPCPDPVRFSLLRPDPPGRPTTVALGMMLYDISALNDVDQTMTADVMIVLRWKDARLADPLRAEGSADCAVPERLLWMPTLEADNLRARQQFYEAHFLVNATGVVTLARRMLIQVSYPLDFRDFPFDRHTWRFTVWPAVSRADEIVFHATPRLTNRNEHFSIQGWSVGRPEPSAAIDNRAGRFGSYARFDVSTEVRRDWVYFAWKLGVPLTLIVLMGYTVYFIPSTAVPQQVAMGMTSMLTLIAYMLALGNSLPKITYLTRADKFFIGSALLVFLGLLKAVLTTMWVQRENKRAIQASERLGRWLYPAGMLANMMNAFIR